VLWKELTVVWLLVKECGVNTLKTLNVAEFPVFERRRQTDLTQQLCAQLT